MPAFSSDFLIFSPKHLLSHLDCIIFTDVSVLYSMGWNVYSMGWNVYSMGWNVYSMGWNVHSAPWNVKQILPETDYKP